MATELAVAQVDRRKVEQAIRLFLEGIGEDPDREGLKDTPRRVANMWLEFRQRRALSAAFFSNEKSYDEIILVKDISLFSLCEHHLLPFIGKAHVAYIPAPNGNLVGLSKIARIVDHFALGLNIQEELTTNIAEYLWEFLKPQGVAVVIEAEHLCVSMRGVQKPGHTTKTSKMLGAFMDEPIARAEVMQLL